MCRSCDEGGARCTDHRTLRLVDVAELRPRGHDDIPDVDWGTEVPTAADLYATHDMDVAAATIFALRRIAGHEPAITRDVASAIPADCRPDGLAFRMKSPGSLARKIATKTEQRPDLNAHDVSTQLTDFVRYTVISPRPDRLASSATEVITQLEQKGWTVREVEHSFVDGNPYKGLHVIATSPHAPEQGVEIQFHTEAGIAVKNEYHAQYELMRSPQQTRGERDAAYRVMADAWSGVPVPVGVDGLVLGGVAAVPKSYPNLFKMK